MVVNKQPDLGQFANEVSKVMCCSVAARVMFPAEDTRDAAELTRTFTTHRADCFWVSPGIGAQESSSQTQGPVPVSMAQAELCPALRPSRSPQQRAPLRWPWHPGKSHAVSGKGKGLRESSPVTMHRSSTLYISARSGIHVHPLPALSPPGSEPPPSPTGTAATAPT